MQTNCQGLDCRNHLGCSIERHMPFSIAQLPILLLSRANIRPVHRVMLFQSLGRPSIDEGSIHFVHCIKRSGW